MATFEELIARIERLEAERDQYKRLYELMYLENQRLRRALFGRKAEVIDSRQAQLAFELAVPELAKQLELEEHEKQRVRGHERKKAAPHGRAPLPDTLPTERIELPPPVDTKGMVKIGEEVSETVEWRAASLVRVQLVRPKYASKKAGEGSVVVAELPERAVPRCKAGVGLLSHVIVSKYADHIPLNRQTRIFARHGLEIQRSTLCGWLRPCAKLLSVVVRAMLADAMSSPWIGVDATGVLVRHKGEYGRGHFWVLVAGGAHVLFRYTRRHDGESAHELLKGYKGFVLADASSVYHELYRREQVIEVGCWSHGRRGFFEALASDNKPALVALGFIRKLYDVERSLSDLDLDSKLAERRSRAGPIVNAFFDWVAAEKPKAVPKSPLGKALSYVANQKRALMRFLDDARLRLDNNLSELALRREVVGRKNWLFCASEAGAEWNTTFVSLIASCALHGLEPWSYLRDVLSLVARWPARRALELSPRYFAATVARDDVRRLLDADPLRAVSLRDDEGHAPPQSRLIG